MADIDTIPQETKAEIEQIGRAELVIGLLGCDSSGSAEASAVKATEKLRLLAPDINAVFVHWEGSPEPGKAAANDSGVRLLEFPRGAESESLLQAGRARVRAQNDLFGVARLLAADACCLICTDEQSEGAECMARLIEPILTLDQDLVIARYQRPRFDGLINTAIIYPLLSAVYGKRVQWPMAQDLGFSRKMVERCLSARQVRPGQAVDLSPAWITTAAVTGGLQVCQAGLRTRPESARPGADLSTVLAELLGPIFLEMERDAPFWQKIRGSQSVPVFGDAIPVSEESSHVDVRRMIESFQLGFRNLQEVWNLALSPATILGMKKLTRLAPDQFRMPDELWVRIVYDFALAFRARVMNRDHLLRAVTPVYLAWVASYALEVQDAHETEVKDRIERLCGVYEAEKPYFQSRWRWPDRFNP
ncbi:MAG: hypothetical protein ABJF23_15915 [Bryobacteraceae bacterium]